MQVYYPSLSCQRESMQTLYPEPHQNPCNLTMYLNHASSSSSSGFFSEILTGNNSSISPPTCIELPPVGVRNEMVFIPPISDVPSFHGINNNNVMGNSVSGGELNFQGQGLSLTLGTQIPSSVSNPQFQYQYPNVLHPLLFSTNSSISAKETFSCGGNESEKNKELVNSQHMPSGFTSGTYINVYQCETPGFVNSILLSKYLKPAQQLLDEVVNIRKELKQLDNNKGQCFYGLSDTKENDGGSSVPATNGISSNPSESNGSSSELSPSERHDLQDKKTKLLSMLDEVDRRYNQYYHQMQALASSFEMVSGFGAAKPYTSLALHRISRHFRCLLDAIRGQIRITQRKLGEQEFSDDQGERIPRLRYLDQRLRQQKALHQQLGMVRPAWRPQRGLPENAVSILRAWLFEHFLHPYPKESEKIMLAKQTGLTKNQVGNWFINARVRLWKPMIEEMYREEFGDSGVNSKSSHENAPKEQTDNNSTTSEVKHEELQESLICSSADTNVVFLGNINDPKPNHISNEQISQPNAYGLDYHVFNLDNSVDYRYMGLGNQQDRVANPHQFLDFVV